ncbi:hypothetical protein Tco_0492416 [Tanacetum coccineum]
MIPPVFSSFYNNPCLKDVQAFYAKESPIFSTRFYYLTAFLTPSSGNWTAVLLRHSGSTDSLAMVSASNLTGNSYSETGKLQRVLSAVTSAEWDGMHLPNLWVNEYTIFLRLSGVTDSIPPRLISESEEILLAIIKRYVTQKTYAYADVHAHNQDLLMTISELKSKLKTINKGKHVNTKFEKSKTLGQLLCVTPFNKNIAIKAKNVSNTKINQEDTKTKDSKANINVSNSTGVGSLNSVRRPKSKDNKSKNNVLKNTKSSSTYVLKTTNSVFLDSNKFVTKPLNVCQTNACRTRSKTVNAVNNGLNMLCISCGLDVFVHSHEKCVTRNALTRKSSVKRALFTSPVIAKSKGLGATSVVAKSRFSVAKT